MTWDPAAYGTFSQPRLRPALDLMARIKADAPARVADLGCGTGNVTRLLAARWPMAEVTGVDSSPEMLGEMPGEAGGFRAVQADMASWRPDTPLDVLFSNAALHWLDGHATLFPHLVSLLAPGGTLAVQMPRNHQAQSHVVMAQVAQSGPWAETLAPLLRTDPVAEPAFYYQTLAPLVADIDIWQTEYLHMLDGDDAVYHWVMGTALKPLADALDEPDRSDFLIEVRERLRNSYPREANGKTPFAFKRLFIVAKL